jgi:hypothetical protein
MNEFRDPRPFYRDPGWILGFVFSMVVVIVIYFLVIRPAQVRQKMHVSSANTPQAVSGQQQPGTEQPGEGWQEGISFMAPGTMPTDLLRVGEEVWVLADNGQILYRLTLSGDLISELTLTTPCLKAAWDGQVLWCINTSLNVTGVDPNTGDELSNFAASVKDLQSITWDGMELWLMTLEGNLANFDRKGEQLERKGGSRYGFARDLVWAGDDLWVGYIPPVLAQMDKDLKLIKKVDPSCGIAQGTLDFAMDWDGKSLWFVDGITGRVTQCVPTGS